MKVYVLISLLIKVVAIIIVTTVFEFTKALTSTRLGDTVPKSEGRLTLNPFKHFEPVGFLLFFFTGYGWGQPVRTSAMYYKDRKTGTLITNITPIVFTLILGVVLSYVAKVVPFSIAASAVAVLARYFVHIAIFNIIPVAPMCGSKILACYMNPTTALRYSQNEKIVQMAFMFLWFLGIVTPILNAIVNLVMV